MQTAASGREGTLFSIPTDTQRLIAAIEDVTGPLRRQNQFHDVGPWRLAAIHRGREIRIRVHTDASVLDGVSCGASLGGRPITLAIRSRTTTMPGLPRVESGDPVFDAQFVVYGWPRDVIVGVLDPPTRKALLDRSQGGPVGLTNPVAIDPKLRTEDGFLFWYRHLRVMDGLVALPRGRVPSAGEIRQWLDEATAFADRTTSTFDGIHAAILAARGPAEAARYVQRHEAADASRVARRRLVRLLLVLAVVVTVGLALLLIGCIAFSALVLGPARAIIHL